MKKYRYCFFLCLALGLVVLGSAVCFFAGKKQPVLDPEESQTMEGETWMSESETVAEDRIVLNQENIQPLPAKPESRSAAAEKEKKEYLLVSEDGFLLVFGNNAREICLYTHIPITDFPEEEQEKLREGIWFSQMEEIYNYLESYTS